MIFEPRGETDVSVAPFCVRIIVLLHGEVSCSKGETARIFRVWFGFVLSQKGVKGCFRFCFSPCFLCTSDICGARGFLSGYGVLAYAELVGTCTIIISIKGRGRGVQIDIDMLSPASEHMIRWLHVGYG